MTEVDRFESSTGNIIALRTDGTQWEVANLTADARLSGRKLLSAETTPSLRKRQGLNLSGGVSDPCGHLPTDVRKPDRKGGVRPGPAVPLSAHPGR